MLHQVTQSNFTLGHSEIVYSLSTPLKPFWNLCISLYIVLPLSIAAFLPSLSKAWRQYGKNIRRSKLLTKQLLKRTSKLWKASTSGPTPTALVQGGGCRMTSDLDAQKFAAPHILSTEAIRSKKCWVFSFAVQFLELSTSQRRRNLGTRTPKTDWCDMITVPISINQTSKEFANPEIHANQNRSETAPNRAKDVQLQVANKSGRTNSLDHQPELPTPAARY